MMDNERDGCMLIVTFWEAHTIRPLDAIISAFGCRAHADGIRRVLSAASGLLWLMLCGIVTHASMIVAIRGGNHNAEQQQPLCRRRRRGHIVCYCTRTAPHVPSAHDRVSKQSRETFGRGDTRLIASASAKSSLTFCNSYDTARHGTNTTQRENGRRLVLKPSPRLLPWACR